MNPTGHGFYTYELMGIEVSDGLLDKELPPKPPLSETSKIGQSTDNKLTTDESGVNTERDKKQEPWEGIEPPSKSTSETSVLVHRPDDKAGSGEPSVTRHSTDNGHYPLTRLVSSIGPRHFISPCWTCIWWRRRHGEAWRLALLLFVF